MKIKKIKVYDYKELSKVAKERAYKDWRADVEHDFLGELMGEKLDELLKKYKIKSENAETYFSLSYCQGDGAMFYGEFEWKKYTIYIKHSGRYYHSNSKTIEIQETKDLGMHIDDEYEPEGKNNIYTKFEAVYQKICKELEDFGYKCIEDEESLEHFLDVCNDYQYTFTIDGKMENL